MKKDQIIAVCLSGRGDKDIFSVAEYAGRKAVSRLCRQPSPRLKKEGRAAFVPFITAGDPDMETSFAILEQLPACGADIIELGMPFTDPMADGPAVQASSVRALKSGATMAKVLKMVEKFRKTDKTTPIVLMGYYNPIHAYGTARFAQDVAAAGVDGLIVVDLPIEEDEVLRVPAKAQGVDLIRFVTPTTDEARLKRIVADASAAIFIMSRSPASPAPSRCRKTKCAPPWRACGPPPTPLPIHAGWRHRSALHRGLRHPHPSRPRHRPMADGVVVGSAIVSQVADNI